MPILKQGSLGPAVTRLQDKLKALGFGPGVVDGKFGPATKTALIAFQKSKGLTADGLAGPQTLAALQLNGNDTNAGAKPKVNLDAVSKMFPGVPVNNIKENLPSVLQALADAGLDDKEMILMALATIRAETGIFMPISEFKSKYNTSPLGHPFDLYDNRQDLGNQGPPDGAQFKGRGYIQLTGRANYRIHGEAIGLGNQLLDDPELANEPEIAAKLLASFLKTKEQQIRKALLAGDLKTARRLVNGGSHGLEEFTQAFKTGEHLIA
jgi:predicted chitinase